jgi:hypothetical protein
MSAPAKWVLATLYDRMRDYDKEVLNLGDSGQTTLTTTITLNIADKTAHMEAVWRCLEEHPQALEGQRTIDWNLALDLLAVDVTIPAHWRLPRIPMESVGLDHLKPLAINWLVARILGYTPKIVRKDQEPESIWTQETSTEFEKQFDPVNNWALAGPIINIKGISTVQRTDGWWESTHFSLSKFADQDQLTAAMRCLILSTLGYEVEIPKELA